jgi:hypothetical protein
MRICRTAEWVSVVSDSEGLVMFVTPDGEGTARNISKTHKVIQSGKLENEIIRRNRINIINQISSPNFNTLLSLNIS